MKLFHKNIEFNFDEEECHQDIETDSNHDDTSEGSTNNMFSFTSMGGKIDHAINSGGGPYTFVLLGINYHTIGSLMPLEGARPVYSQLYIHDTDNEVTNRIADVSKHQKRRFN
ncbi:hypothetical protein K1719_032413 [Acacia pycnantha]|nr:hypothetical protein K1719_032413 [Acacia pycnantha]